MHNFAEIVSEPRKHLGRWIAITVMLGAVGSGAWEFILKPSSGILVSWMLILGTLGIDSFKDSIYTEIADGHHEASAISVYHILTSTFLAVSFIFSERAIRKLRGITPKKGRPPARRGFLWFGLLYMIFFFVFMLIQQTRRTYINSAVTYFERVLAISRPSLNDEEHNQIRSEFAMISSKEDYADLVVRLEQKAKTLYPDRKLPKFKAW